MCVKVERIFKANLYVSPIIIYYDTLFNAISTSWRSVHSQLIWRLVGAIIKSTTNKAHDNRRVQRDRKERQDQNRSGSRSERMGSATQAGLISILTVWSIVNINTAYRVAQIKQDLVIDDMEINIWNR